MMKMMTTTMTGDGGDCDHQGDDDHHHGDACASRGRPDQQHGKVDQTPKYAGMHCLLVEGVLVPPIDSWA